MFNLQSSTCVECNKWQNRVSSTQKRYDMLSHETNWQKKKLYGLQKKCDTQHIHRVIFTTRGIICHA